MARKGGWGIEFDEFQGLINQLKALEANIEDIAEKALTETQSHIAKKLDELTEDDLLPAKGKYRANPSYTKEAILDDNKVRWDGETASIHTGFSLWVGDDDEFRLVPLFLMYGTPYMDPVPGLEEIIKGKEGKKEAAKIQRDIFVNAIKELEDGN